MMILSTFVRLGILVWSGAILTLAYVELPPTFKIPKQDLDPTFIASVFTGVLATFGVQTSKKGGSAGGGGGGVSKSDMEKLIGTYFTKRLLLHKQSVLNKHLFKSPHKHLTKSNY